ncbi:MAG: hypothetical protein BRC44_15810 [Cyanobacteria bacterium QS_4_48_99]|nr:MAG: hypothetical protein BRC44_15810 [Cyanobacteria bacterium QS_4_48_99]
MSEGGGGAQVRRKWVGCLLLVLPLLPCSPAPGAPLCPSAFFYFHARLVFQYLVSLAKYWKIRAIESV